jgi:hypothetical protein
MGDSALVHFGCWRISGSPEILCVGPAGTLAVMGGVLLHRRSSHSPSRGHWRATHPPPIDLVAKL